MDLSYACRIPIIHILDCLFSPLLLLFLSFPSHDLTSLAFSPSPTVVTPLHYIHEVLLPVTL